MSEEPGDRAGEEFLDPAEVAPLFAGLHDSSVEVRIAMLQALTRLPLAPSDWTKVGAFAASVFNSTSTSEERRAVIDLAPWVPLGWIRDLVAQLAVEGEDEDLQTHAAKVAAKLTHRHVPREMFEGSQLRAVWADGDPPGFTAYPASELSNVRAELDRLGLPVDHVWERGDDDRIWGLDERIMAPLLERSLAPAAVTVLFERAGSRNVFLGNDILAWVQSVQGRFRPDLEGLFNRYWQLAVERGFDGRSPFMGANDEDGPRQLCWQIGWTVSRGGLHGLVPGLATHLTGADPTERVAASFLIGDAADYVLWPSAPLFGGGGGPERAIYTPLPGYEEPVPFDQYVCPEGDYRWSRLGVSDLKPPPKECPVHHIPLVLQRAGTSW